ncbi:MAG: hypothetical protein KGO81_00215 [Bacteroidota bacterium]|nr:hypothetical protein [Bacteroidota bacterium]
MGWMITCKQATDYISRKEEGKLSLLKRVQLWQHLAICNICKLFMKQNTVITKHVHILDKETNASLTAEEKKAMAQKIVE